VEVLGLVLSYLLLTPAQGDAQLAALRTTVVSLREHQNENREARDATAELTVAKHRFRDWVESRLTGLGEDGDTVALEGDLQAAMIEADLYCTDYNIQCFPSSLGFLDDIRINREKEFLIVRTAVGIWCGYDYSAYVYRWSGNRWQRIWENEQNTYTPEGYVPQLIHSVQLSTPDAEGNRLVLTLGSKPGCASAFLPVYYRVFSMNARYEVGQPIFEGSELANIDGEPPIQGRVGPDDVLMRFTAGGTGYGDSHQAVRHFEVRNGRAIQVDPIAGTPRDFVEEWISSQWTISGPRSETPALKQWYDRLHREDGMGDFPDPAVRCTSSPNLWQIGTHFQDAPKIYYLVRWREPYNFTMVGINDTPFSDCTMVDPKGDEFPDLF
jgi:hypothetical protein